MSQRIFYFPYHHVNRYVELNRQTLQQTGAEVHSYRQLYSLHNLRQRNNNTVVLNWFEDRPYRRSFSKPKRWLELLRTIGALLVMRRFCQKVIWVRHNHRPHNVNNAAKSLHNNVPVSHLVNCWLLNAIADHVVTMEPTAFASEQIPHPLYRSDQQLQTANSENKQHNSHSSFLFFGTIKPYKQLEQLLQHWPADITLTILGYCADPHYYTELNNLINQRRLKVNWHNAYVDEKQLNHTLADCRYVIMPHSDESMISSGTFYHAASYGTNFVCFDSEFARSKAARHNFVHLVDKERLTEQLKKLPYIERQEVITQCLRDYGESARLQAWQRLL
ncbi:hypothetical protein [Neptunicella marina]|uniref:Glycosyltransferase n=1 Tax=Neptunicella marina TaxID=2125989 RepID=A0A8J6IYK1_9ALTE|nr:hypothetical protein [Neptunicella marina]MBC3767640.1 hypothetical protein [Neptunicella marina]